MRALLLVALLPLAADAQTRYVWTGGDGNWTEATNWSPNGVPAAADTAVVESATNRVVTLTANTTVGGLKIAGLGAIDGNFDLTVIDRLVWRTANRNFDTIRGAGTLTVGSDAVMRLAEDAGGFRVASDRLLLNKGVLIWEAPTDWHGQGRLVNEGEIDLALDADGATGDVVFAFHTAPDAITNTTSGVIRRTGPGNARYNAGLVNDGLIRVEAGSLDLLGFNTTGTTGSGSIEVEPGGAMRISGGFSTVHTQARVSGSALTVGGGQLTVTDGYDVATTRLGSGNSARLVLDADGTTETLVMATGALDGSGTLAVTGAMTWTGGTMEGTGTTVLGPGVPLDISGGNVNVSGSRTLRLEGTTTWTGHADIGSGTTTATLVNAGMMTSSGAGERVTNFVTFRNEGTFVHDGGTLRFQSPMTNEGVVRIDDGVVAFNSTGTDTGRYEVAETGRMEFVFGTRSFADAAEVAGTGTVMFTGGTVTNRATWRPGASAGTLTIGSDWPAPAPEAVLDMEVGGTTPGTEHDQLVVSGTAALGGTLRMTLVDGYEPAPGDRVVLLRAAAVTGAFDAVELPDGLPGEIETTDTTVVYVRTIGVASDAGPEAVPDALALDPPAPNPTSAAVTLAVALPEAGPVRLAVYDALGREVAVLLDREMPAGTHAVRLGAGRLAPGVYVVRLGAGPEAVSQMLTVVRSSL